MILAKKTTVSGQAVYTEFPIPTEITYAKQTLDSEATGRNQAGTMFRDVVADKVKVQVKWGVLSGADIALIYSLCDDVFFTLYYPDASTGQCEEMECYVGDRSVPAYKLYDGDWAWTGLSISFIQR